MGATYSTDFHLKESSAASHSIDQRANALPYLGLRRTHLCRDDYGSAVWEPAVRAGHFLWLHGEHADLDTGGLEQT
jgi:hypothetical protein